MIKTLNDVILEDFKEVQPEIKISSSKERAFIKSLNKEQNEKYEELKKEFELQKEIEFKELIKVAMKRLSPIYFD